MGFFDSKEERDREDGEKCGEQERKFSDTHLFSPPINELAGDLESAFRGPEFNAAREAAREGKEYEPPERDSDNTGEQDNSDSSPSYAPCDYDSSGGSDSPVIKVEKSRQERDQEKVENNALGCLALAVFILGGAWLLLDYNSSREESQQRASITREYVKSSNLERAMGAEEAVSKLFQYIQKNSDVGDLNTYQVVVAPGIVKKEDKEIALFNRHNFYVFHSLDDGKTWTCAYPTDPDLIKLIENNYKAR